MSAARGAQPMTKAILCFEEGLFELDLFPLPDLSDDAFFVLCQRNALLRLERTAAGEIVVMPPAGAETSYRNVRICAALDRWAQVDGTGIAFDSSAGFVLPNGATRSPDGAWVRRDRCWAAGWSNRA